MGNRSRPLAIERSSSTDRSRLEAAAEGMNGVRENNGILAEAIREC
jgi:hypothetical protein